jgi:hypothetical protein
MLVLTLLVFQIPVALCSRDLAGALESLIAGPFDHAEDALCQPLNLAPEQWVLVHLHIERLLGVARIETDHR